MRDVVEMYKVCHTCSNSMHPHYPGVLACLLIVNSTFIPLCSLAILETRSNGTAHIAMLHLNPFEKKLAQDSRYTCFVPGLVHESGNRHRLPSISCIFANKASSASSIVSRCGL